MIRTRVNALAAIAVTAALAVAIPALAFGSASASSTHTVTLHEIRFHPATLKIHRGDKVKWVWQDEVEHNVTFSQRTHSPTQEKGTYTLRFTRAGAFNYHCTIHFAEGMKGKIIVH
jgi:plastocyanin